MQWARYSNPVRQYWWVEDDDEVVLFVGTNAEARKFYRDHSSKSKHLMSGLKAEFPRPVVGEVVP